MERIVVKFGGSSLADAGQFRKVRAILEADRRRRIVVVSAPGKRQASDQKITDLLYRCHQLAASGADFAVPLEEISHRFACIAEDLNVSSPVPAEMARLATALTGGCSADFAASRGEFCAAALMAAYLGAELIDPADCIALDRQGQVAPESYASLGERLADLDRLYVMAGFYGHDRQGQVKTFSRGGSDISGAVAARAAGAILYENWTDTSGILMADPRIIDCPRNIEEISFREVREMSYMGASVFHDEAILPVRAAAIPIRIKNTNHPEDPGTLITPRLSEATLSATEIAGIAGKKGFAMISVEKTLLHRELGFAHRLLGILHQHGVSFEHCPSSIDSLSVIVEEQLPEGKVEAILADISAQLRPDTLDYEQGLALVAVVGEGMAYTVGIAAKVFTALQQGGVNVRIINQGASEINIIVGVAAADYEAAVRAIYQAFAG